MDGFRNAIAHEAAVREELATLVVLGPLAWWLPVSRVESLLLFASVLLVIVVELLNTAVERTVDRISSERHPLAGNAKDIGSAAVLVAVVMSIVCWITIAGPVVMRWWRR
ncbi:MAG: diacylglycerol kinase [Gemmatimonadetes bacterium]|nr:diacylglycerol kinase [Gemmatimonadota bacterium]